MTAYSQVAHEFAQALARGQFDAAAAFLAPSLSSEYDASGLAREMKEMLDYADGPINHVEVMDTLDDWPTKQEHDIGWAYVAMSGGTFSEGIAVVISEIESEPLVRKIEWGRP